MDKCKFCENEAEFKVMVEDDYNPQRNHTDDVCGEHYPKYGIIESWTKMEWLSLD